MSSTRTRFQPYASDVRASGLRVRSVNGDIGDLNAVLDAGRQAARDTHLDALLSLTAKTAAKALVLPCGALSHEPVRSVEEDLETVAAQLIRAGERAAEFGVELWTESLHFLRFCWNLERAELLARRLAGSGVGIVMDFSHIVAAGEDPLEYLSRHEGRIAHVHLRDAVPGNINLSIGNGHADFAAGLQDLAAQGYTGHFTPGTRNPGHHPRRTPGRRSQGSQLHHRPHLIHPQRKLPRRIMSAIQRTAVLTGATSERGIGITTARRYASQGWGVVILDLDGEKSAKVATEIGNEFNVPAFGYEIDVANEDSVNAAYRAVSAEVGRGALPAVGALANIAGITSPVPFLETTLDLWNKVMAVNSTGTYLVTKAFLPAMIDNGWGRIVNMSSVSAQRGGGVFGKVPYSAAKAAILGFTKALARELGDSGVTVNAITPGAVDTNIRVGSTDEQEAAINAGIPLGRNASAEEVAAVITFLSSDESAYLTGTTIDINGGSHMH